MKFSFSYRISNEQITACLSANRHGLCVGGLLSLISNNNNCSDPNYTNNEIRHIFSARGNISQNSSGVLVALLDQAQQLEPNSNPPVIALETSKKYIFFFQMKHNSSTNMIIF